LGEEVEVVVVVAGKTAAEDIDDQHYFDCDWGSCDLNHLEFEIFYVALVL